jgi:exodeoxyribonuclease V beta subunit
MTVQEHTTLLDPLRLPLWGGRFIEASAGTGKTWAIAALYLRLVLGHGRSGEAFVRPLMPCDIVVLTFTRAATHELVTRIRARLLEAAAIFSATAVEPSSDQVRSAMAQTDPLLKNLLSEYADQASRHQAAQRLEHAAQNMDQAAIYTLDAWFQRLLREHVWSDRSLSSNALLADEGALRWQATQDYWRQQIYPLPTEDLKRVLQVWPTLARVYQDVCKSAAVHTADTLGTEPPLGQFLTQWGDKHRTDLSRIKMGWPERCEQLLDWLQMQFESNPCPFDKKKLAPRFCLGWLQALSQWALEPEQTIPALSATAWQRLRPQGLRETLKPGHETIALAQGFEHIAPLEQALQGLAPLAPLLHQHAANHVAQHMAELKETLNQYSFSDVEQRLNIALHSTQTEALRQIITGQYPVALVDEFQDTSAVQSHILNTLYRWADNPTETAIILIGDPKQSIYAFRGADIGSYLSSRHLSADRRYALETNYRSSHAMVNAVNYLFTQAEIPLERSLIHKKN